MINKLVCSCLLAAAGLAAADQPAPDVEVRVVALKHLRGERLRAIANSARAVLDNNSSLTYDTNLNIVLLRGVPRQIGPIETLLRSADVSEPAPRPDPQAQLRVHFVVGSPDSGKDGPVAPEIASAVEQMRKAFAYKSYRELDALVVQVRDQGSADLNGVLPVDSPRPDAPATYALQVNQLAISADTGSVALRDFRLSVSLPPPAPPPNTMVMGTGQWQARLKTDLTIQKGQKVVVGKLTSDQHKDAIFVVLAADII